MSYEGRLRIKAGEKRDAGALSSNEVGIYWICASIATVASAAPARASSN
jgi:hypothetical protein